MSRERRKGRFSKFFTINIMMVEDKHMSVVLNIRSKNKWPNIIISGMKPGLGFSFWWNKGRDFCFKSLFLSNSYKHMVKEPNDSTRFVVKISKPEPCSVSLVFTSYITILYCYFLYVDIPLTKGPKLLHSPSHNFPMYPSHISIIVSFRLFCFLRRFFQCKPLVFWIGKNYLGTEFLNWLSTSTYFI